MHGKQTPPLAAFYKLQEEGMGIILYILESPRGVVLGMNLSECLIKQPWIESHVHKANSDTKHSVNVQFQQTINHLIMFKIKINVLLHHFPFVKKKNGERVNNKR